jgi:hypothetical protein
MTRNDERTSTLLELREAETVSVRCYHGINHIADLFHELTVAAEAINIEGMHDVDRLSAVRWRMRPS